MLSSNLTHNTSLTANTLNPSFLRLSQEIKLKKKIPANFFGLFSTLALKEISFFNFIHKPRRSYGLTDARSWVKFVVVHGWIVLWNNSDKVIKLQSQLVGNASKVKEICRVFELVNGELSYVVQMATNLTGLQPHLNALLRKL